ncbi:phosphatidylinositol phosphatase PTPRQ-like, partial [Atheta coriaria]|uniref:phosphatidylinositol phosphatase PTPRQ-like n=1 Tax=Dalotia coriaria TaxID=877792 RepID=UPI0031F3928B
PNKVKNSQVNASSHNTLSVVWEEPNPVLGIITNYIVTWRFLDKRDCRVANNTANIQTKNITTTAIELDDLKPYSIYNISISAVTKKGQGDIEHIIGYTDETDTIELHFFNYKITSSKTSIQIDTHVDCENWNGPTILSAYTCIWSKAKKNNVTKEIQYNDVTIIKDLLPFTKYKLEIYLYRNHANSVSNYNKLLSSYEITLSTVPNQVPFAEVYSLSETSLSLRWRPPYPPTGILDSFVIKYYYTLGEHSTPRTDTNSLSACKIWKNMYCTTLTNLTTNKNYIISIAGRNQNISENGLETILNETTLIKTPQSPLNLFANWNESRFLELQWQHPNRTNGPFFGFIIRVNDRQYFYQGPENITYAYMTPFQCKLRSHHVILSIQTTNSKFNSILLPEQITCPIFEPLLKHKSFLRPNNNNSVTISVPCIENAEAISNLYIILVTNEPAYGDDCTDTFGSKYDSLVPIQKNQTCWIIGHYEQHEYKEIEETKA